MPDVKVLWATSTAALTSDTSAVWQPGEVSLSFSIHGVESYCANISPVDGSSTGILCREGYMSIRGGRVGGTDISPLPSFSSPASHMGYVLDILRNVEAWSKEEEVFEE